MHRFNINGTSEYYFVSNIGFYLMLFLTLFYYKSKRNAMGLYSRNIIFAATKINKNLGIITELLLFAIESLLAAYLISFAVGSFNRSFGEFIGTGANYFGMLLTVMFFWIVLSVLLMANPLKILDISTMYLPVHLFFVKLSCYCAGCCWGIPWKYGPYNYHPDHPGNQVPVQMIEAIWALLIFLFLLWYRKKAKVGTVFPIYMILYSATRFLSEFFRHEENVLGPLKMYHILCLIGIAYGIFHLVFLHFYRDTINEFFDNMNGKLDAKIARYEADKVVRIKAEKEREETDRKVRAEKAKQNRAKAKARKK